MIVGLTGGIACGKSTVADMLLSHGAILIDADRIAREVVEPGRPALAEVAERFGPDVLLDDGTLNRKKLGSIVFQDQDARKALEAIVHPAIGTSIMEQINVFRSQQTDKLAVFDIPLLFESGYDKVLPEIIVVYVPEDVQLERLMKRDRLDAEQAKARMDAQMPVAEKKRRATFVIDNSGSLEETRRQVQAFVRGKGLSP